MRDNYDTQQYWEMVGHSPGSVTYTCEGLRTLSLYCRGDAGQLEQALEPTPFTLVDDRFVVSVADFSQGSNGSFMDAGIVMSVRYGDEVGGFYRFEYENQSRTIAGGRENWGYPKVFAEIALESDPVRASAVVDLRGEKLISAHCDFDDSAVGDWMDVKLFPHLLVRAVSEPAGDRFQSFDILQRDTSPNFVLKSSRIGTAQLELSPSLEVRGEPLKVLEVLGAVYTVGDYASTREYGTPTVLASLI